MEYSYFVKTQRLNIYPLSNQDMEVLVTTEQNPDMKEVYSEMFDCCKEYPDQRIWYTVWNMQRNDETGKSVGDLAFKGIDEDGMVEVGYGIKDGYEGRGYMTEAIAAMALWASEQQGVNRVEAETTIENKASQRVLEKAGFHLNGVNGSEGPRYIFDKV